MSNILIIKHGSLGDIVQISGALKDIRVSHKDDKIFILTTFPYVDLLSRCPFIDGVLIDKRLPRWNFFYLLKLKKMVNKFNFSKIYDLQNSSRTKFYKRFIIKDVEWSSTETALESGQGKERARSQTRFRTLSLGTKPAPCRRAALPKPSSSPCLGSGDINPGVVTRLGSREPRQYPPPSRIPNPKSQDEVLPAREYWGVSAPLRPEERQLIAH